MKSTLLIGVACSFAFLSAAAQEAGNRPERAASVMLGVGNSLTNLSMSYQLAWRFGQKEKLRMGVGLRYNYFSSNNQYFVTAPARSNMDSVQLPWTRTFSLNILIHISYAFSEKLKAGFNIDVIGFSHGPSSPGTYINGNAPDAIFTKPVNAAPSSFNLLLIGDNDLGSLNSEFFLLYSLNEKWALKGGVQHIFIEYTTETQVQQYPEPNDRFRITPTVACFGVVYTIR